MINVSMSFQRTLDIITPALGLEAVPLSAFTD